MPKTLLLIPTEKEWRAIQPALAPREWIEPRICGFGLVAATANAGKWIQELHPDQVVLCGLAGTYQSDRLPVGSAAFFDSVAQFGIGCVREDFQLPSALGFEDPADQTIALDLPLHAQTSGTLVSVTASGMFSSEQILATYPSAVAEDMESYGVAAAARAVGVPLRVLRGISNVVGEPFADWKIDQAIVSLRLALESNLAERD